MGRKKKLGFIKEFNIYTSKKLIFKILTSFQWKRQDLIISIILRQHKQQQGRGQGQHPLPSNVHRLRKPRKTKHPSSQIKLSFKLAERKTLVLSRLSMRHFLHIGQDLCQTGHTYKNGSQGSKKLSNNLEEIPTSPSRIMASAFKRLVDLDISK